MELLPCIGGVVTPICEKMPFFIVECKINAIMPKLCTFKKYNGESCLKVDFKKETDKE